MGIHDGHRERLRESFRKDGLAGFDSVRALELLLQFAIPRKDTNPIAHALLDSFGSLDEVFDASEEELCRVPGVGPSAATLLRLLPQILRKSAVERAAKKPYLMNTADVRDYLSPYFLYAREELAILLCLDSQRRVLKCLELNRGVVNTVSVDVRKVMETALKLRCAGIILAHNHPDGPACNSREDDMVTSALQQALRTVRIPLLDHVIFGRDGMFSYQDSGALKMMSYF